MAVRGLRWSAVTCDKLTVTYECVEGARHINQNVGKVLKKCIIFKSVKSRVTLFFKPQLIRLMVSLRPDCVIFSLVCTRFTLFVNVSNLEERKSHNYV